MEAILNYLGMSFGEVYLIALTFCLVCSFKIRKVFQLALITVCFSLFSKLFLFDFLYSRGPEYWAFGWSVYELAIIASIVCCRLFVNKHSKSFILSDIILIAASVVQILVYLLTYAAKSSNSTAMDIVYAATAPTLYLVTIFVLLFPSIYKFTGYLQGIKEFNSESNHDNRTHRGMFSARVYRFVLGY